MAFPMWRSLCFGEALTASDGFSLASLSVTVGLSSLDSARVTWTWSLSHEAVSHFPLGSQRRSAAFLSLTVHAMSGICDVLETAAAQYFLMIPPVSVSSPWIYECH